MKLLLDTCAALWWWDGSSRLSAAAEAALEEQSNEVALHQVTFLEIAIKHSRGKLGIPKAPQALVAEALEEYELAYHRLGDRDIVRLATLPLHHRDPFDRLLIAHALEHSLTVVTSDSKFVEYGVSVLW